MRLSELQQQYWFTKCKSVCRDGTISLHVQWMETDPLMSFKAKKKKKSRATIIETCINY